jgi:NAD(P)-dependent dehydrogenase (short-subunit alcohol dehydrogenase family)
LDVVIANAGVGEHGPVGTIAQGQFDATFSTNIKGIVFTTQSAIPLLSQAAALSA